MFDTPTLTRAIRVHAQAYALFRWLNEGLKRGRPPLGKVAEALQFADAAADWIRANVGSFPRDCRPAPADVDAFAHLFASFLSTSFEVVDRAAVRACPGCWCCVYWIEAKHLRGRNPDKKARATARELKRSYLAGLAKDAGVAISASTADELVDATPTLAPALSLATYAHELIRRTQHASQGEGVLALWREIAWDGPRKAKKKFTLDAKKILTAEQALLAKIKIPATEIPARALGRAPESR